MVPTIDVDEAGAMANEALGGPQDIIQAHAQPDLLNDLVGVFGVYVVLYRDDARLREVLWCNLHQVGDLGLRHRAVSQEAQCETSRIRMEAGQSRFCRDVPG